MALQILRDGKIESPFALAEAAQEAERRSRRVSQTTEIAHRAQIGLELHFPTVPGLGQPRDEFGASAGDGALKPEKSETGPPVAQLRLDAFRRMPPRDVAHLVRDHPGQRNLVAFHALEQARRNEDRAVWVRESVDQRRIDDVEP